MALRNSGQRLRMAWRALTGNVVGDGWSTIPIELDGPCRLLAGRHFPGNEEAVLFGFQSVRIPPTTQLPEGRGFRVTKVEHSVDGGPGVWVALSRQSAGKLELFTMMVVDIIETLEACHELSEERVLHQFLDRIRAWQNFMQRAGDGVLSLEEEVGLFGELIVLQYLLKVGIPAMVAVEDWQGPIDGIQDFMIGTGGIEVKTTIAANGFLAKIGSLDQLDDSVRQPLFVAGVRLSVDGSGRMLPDIVADIRTAFQEPAATDMFNSRLLHAGYLDALSDQYTRRFVHASTTMLPINEMFPRLTRAIVGVGILAARYELDLSLMAGKGIHLDLALEQLGGI